jgi:D-beta-D-heptose 7-phosphate kinase/D-beta-D-heptose 1-phosphate adenosyltransferase
VNDRDLLPCLAKCRGLRVAVLGDVMLDRYVWGRASRISQEAPVPVVCVDRETLAPGGAANVARNVCTLGGQAVALGAVGADENGEKLRQVLRESGADADGLTALPDRATTVKTRVLANHQQVVRIDREDTSALTAAGTRRLRQTLLTAIDRQPIGAIILEDYAKGVFTEEFMAEVTGLARQRGIMVALDPHPSHPFNIPGMKLLTPNRAEAFALAGVYYQAGVQPLAKDKALLDVGARLLDLWQADLLLVTLGADGMALFAPGAAPVHIPTRARQVFDVSGAGDTVIAAFVLALLAGATPVDAARLANCAAGIKVAKVGTVGVYAAEMEAELAGHDA